MATQTRWDHGPQGLELLTAPVSAADIKEYRATHADSSSGALAIGTAVTIIAFAIIGFIVITQTSRHGNVGGTMALVLIAIGIGVVIALTTRARAMRKHVRRARFAAANGMTYTPSTRDAHQGMIFGQGSGRHGTAVLRTGRNERPVEFGNWIYTTGSGKSQQTHRWGYATLTLDTPLPHIVLDAMNNNGLFGSNLPVRFGKKQRLSLEGDFDRFFELYCPEGYERDALYLFTPDVMARFIDSASALDVEIIDNRVFFYRQGEMSTDDAATWRWIFTVIATFLAKVDQWERWRDDRLAHERTLPAMPAPARAMPPAQAHDEIAAPLGFADAPQQPTWGGKPDNPFLGRKGVAAGGRRLQSGTNWVAVILVIAVGGFMLFINLMGR